MNARAFWFALVIAGTLLRAPSASAQAPDLILHNGKVLTHGELLREVWGAAHENDVAYLRVYVGHLRHKLEPDPAHPRWLLTEPGVGYRLIESNVD